MKMRKYSLFYPFFPGFVVYMLEIANFSEFDTSFFKVIFSLITFAIKN